MNEQELLTRIREARFACIELQLYLDTHPDDAAAKADYISYAEKLLALIDTYEATYGPLLNFGQSATDAGCWVYGGWPWVNTDMGMGG
ncbi:MAG TPA: spore coat protein CotJB [Eubacteriales bacterium]|nr:spore coat protein CotJB [Clostridia bacterium]HRV73609.1 spore coat protein CotJB [Eubacteriales bacterium]